MNDMNSFLTVKRSLEAKGWKFWFDDYGFYNFESPDKKFSTHHSGLRVAVERASDYDRVHKPTPYFENPEMLDDYTGHDYAATPAPVKAIEQPAAPMADDSEDEAGGFMRPCHRCGGVGAVVSHETGFHIPCSICGGTGIHEDDDSEEIPDLLAEKNRLIASQAAEIARKTELLKRIYDLPYIKDIAISILIEDELGMNDPENSPKFAEHFKALQSPAPLAPEASSEVTLSEDEIKPCEPCGGGGWLLEPVEGYKPRRIRCKYCDGTGNAFGLPNPEDYIENDDIA
jgi:hypothetical protein